MITFMIPKKIENFYTNDSLKNGEKIMKTFHIINNFFNLFSLLTQYLLNY